VFANVLRYAVELEELPSNPLARVSWKPPKVSEVIDRRAVVNPRQARELLTAVTYVGYQPHGRYSRGHRLMALFACMYYAALRPSEVVALRQQDCYLPADGWGCLTLEKSGPRSTGAGPTPRQPTANGDSNTARQPTLAPSRSRQNSSGFSASTSLPLGSLVTVGCSAATVATWWHRPRSVMCGQQLAYSP
jgi:hypothetical protein